jgi:outer membrane protein OmpA-like peptidoglycan-associated protein
MGRNVHFCALHRASLHGALIGTSGGEWTGIPDAASLNVRTITVMFPKLHHSSSQRPRQCDYCSMGDPKQMETTMVSRKHFSKTFALAFLALGALSMPALAGDLSDQQIIEKLKTPKLTRSLSGKTVEAPALTANEAALINRIRKTRSLSVADRDQVASIAKTRPAVDLEINFDYNSASVSPTAEPQLHNLGKALTSAELAGSVFMLGGHTDAKGTDGYNLSLSERRAETVKKFLTENYKIPAENLVSAGYGESDLKNKTDPTAAENRRVQIVNMAKNETASK